MVKTKQKRYKIPKNSHIGKEFSKDYQPTPEAKSRGHRLEQDKKRFRDCLSMVVVQKLYKIKDNDKMQQLILLAKKMFPDLPEEDISYGIALFAQLLSKSKNMTDLEKAFKMAGIIEEKAMVEINNNINEKPKVWDIEELKKIRKALFDK